MPQKFEARDQRDLELTIREFLAKRARVVEIDLAWPTVDEGTGVKVFDAAETERHKSHPSSSYAQANAGSVSALCARGLERR